MTRVAILGNAGGGKTTLCKSLSAAKSLPVYQLDKLQWNPGWVATPTDVFHAKHDELIAKDRWIIDGVATIEFISARLEAADTIIFVDHPLWVHYWWAAKRQFMCLFRPRPDFNPGCPMLPKTWQLIKMIWHIHKYLRPTLLKLISENGAGKKVFHIKSPQELRQFKYVHCANYLYQNA
ncbi:MAG: flagellar protein FlaR [Pseudomonadota bacterium]